MNDIASLLCNLRKFNTLYKHSVQIRQLYTYRGRMIGNILYVLQADLQFKSQLFHLKVHALLASPILEILKWAVEQTRRL